MDAAAALEHDIDIIKADKEIWCLACDNHYPQLVCGIIHCDNTSVNTRGGCYLLSISTPWFFNSLKNNRACTTNITKDALSGNKKHTSGLVPAIVALNAFPPKETGR